jgi:hypothetical protein
MPGSAWLRISWPSPHPAAAGLEKAIDSRRIVAEVRRVDIEPSLCRLGADINWPLIQESI